MRTEDRLFHLNGLVIRGFDEKDQNDGGDDDADDDDSDDDANKDDKGGNSGKKSDGTKDEDDKDTAGLRSALQKERNDRKALAKQIKELQKFKDEAEAKDKTDGQKAQDAADKASKKAERLAVRLRETALENVVTKLATKHKFVDIDDALRLIDRDSITIDQDEDDPSDLIVDEKSVDKALKALAEKKPHLVSDGEGLPASGSKFAGGRKNNDPNADTEALKEKYPALRGVH